MRIAVNCLLCLEMVSLSLCAAVLWPSPHRSALCRAAGTVVDTSPTLHSPAVSYTAVLYRCITEYYNTCARRLPHRCAAPLVRKPVRMSSSVALAAMRARSLRPLQNECEVASLGLAKLSFARAMARAIIAVKIIVFEAVWHEGEHS